MKLAENPTLLAKPFAVDGDKNVIPENQNTQGQFSQSLGFPPETQLPLGAGGVAPSRADFNGAFNLLSGIVFMAQKGFTFNFDENQGYFEGCVVIDPADGKVYRCIADMAAGTVAPHSDTSGEYWQKYDLSNYTETVYAPMFNKRDVITTSGTYTTPVTGWYKITAKGGGGGSSSYVKRLVGSNTIYVPSAGGGEGGTSFGYKYLAKSQQITVVVGAGGEKGYVSASSSVYRGKTGGNSQVLDIVGYGGAGGDYGGKGGFGGNGDIPGQQGQTLIYERLYTAPSSAFYLAPASAGGHGQNEDGTGCGGYGTPVGGYDVPAASQRDSETLPDGVNGGSGFVWFEYFDPSLNS